MLPDQNRLIAVKKTLRQNPTLKQKPYQHRNGIKKLDDDYITGIFPSFLQNNVMSTNLNTCVLVWIKWGEFYTFQNTTKTTKIIFGLTSPLTMHKLMFVCTISSTFGPQRRHQRILHHRRRPCNSYATTILWLFEIDEPVTFTNHFKYQPTNGYLVGRCQFLILIADFVAPLTL